MRLPQPGVRAAAAIYATASVTLVCNDWWLKGAGILPGWLTGKLSDFAGLVVAIITALLVLGHRRARASFTACISIASVFALVKLSPSAAQLLVAALANAGLTWRVRPDPTDLVALAVVPFAWNTARTLTHRMQRVGLGRLALRASAIPAAMACLASGVPDHFSASGYVYNDSNQTLFVEVSTIPWLECDNLELFGTDWLERSDFQSLGLFRVGPHEVVPLSNTCDCLSRVSFEGKSVVVRVPEPTVQLEKSPDRDEVHKARPQLVFVRPGADPLPGSRLEVLEIPVTAAENSCTEEPSPMTFSSRLTVLADARIAAIEAVAGECWELQLVSVEAPSTTGIGGAAGAGGEGSAPGGAAGASGVGGAGSDIDEPLSGIGSERVDVCAPRELFPFGVGDIVTISQRTLDRYGDLTHQLEIIQRTGERGFRLELGAPRIGFVTPITAEASCGPSRDRERWPWLPLEVTVHPSLGLGSAQFGGYALSPGERRDIGLADGTLATVYLGRTRRFFSTCLWNLESSPVETWVEVVESWSP